MELRTYFAYLEREGASGCFIYSVMNKHFHDNAFSYLDGRKFSFTIQLVSHCSISNLIFRILDEISNKRVMCLPHSDQIRMKRYSEIYDAIEELSYKEQCSRFIDVKHLKEVTG